jgi:hypothetical protein
VIAEHGRAIGLGEDRRADIAADLAAVHVPGGNDAQVLGPVAAQVPVHQSDLLVGAAILVMGDALHERTRTIADTDDADVDGVGIREAHQATCRCGRAGA